jgi:anti-sigma B factor antagonist
MSTPATSVLALAGELSIYRAAELRTLLITALAGLAEGGTLALNLAEVSELDCAGVQLLLSAKKTALASQRTLRLVGHSPAVLEVFDTLDLAATFGDPLLMPAARH